MAATHACVHCLELDELHTVVVVVEASALPATGRMDMAARRQTPTVASSNRRILVSLTSHDATVRYVEV